MPSIRDVAFALVARGLLRVLQRGQEIDPASVHGPIRLAAALPRPRAKRKGHRSSKTHRH